MGQPKYHRVYTTEFKRELEQHGINDEVESFINRAFYHYLDKVITERKQKEGEKDGINNNTRTE